MSPKPLSSQILGAAVATLLSASLAGSSGLVLCIGIDGHRAVELEHAATECPTLATLTDGDSSSLQAAAECFDVPAAGTSPAAPSSFDADWVPAPPIAFLAVRLEPAPRVEPLLPPSSDARDGPSALALHLRSTVLLV